MPARCSVLSLADKARTEAFVFMFFSIFLFILLHSDVTTQYENVTRVVNAAMIWFHIPPCRYHPALKSALAAKAGGEVSYEWKAVKTDDDRVYYYNKVTH